MPLKAQIITDLTTAMKEGAERKKETLRMLKAEVMKEEVAGTTKRELTDEEVTKLIRRLIKQRRESADQFRTGNRPELAEAEEAEILFLEPYLPVQMTTEEVTALVTAKKAALSITDESGMGKLIGAIMKDVGDRADGTVVKAAVEASF